MDKTNKTRMSRISFSKKNTTFDPILVNNKQIDIVSYATFLGLHISNDLKWIIVSLKLSRRLENDCIVYHSLNALN